jgi:uncharacterized Fe-S radical SAM superfamily protein PflX
METVSMLDGAIDWWLHDLVNHLSGFGCHCNKVIEYLEVKNEAV